MPFRPKNEKPYTPKMIYEPIKATWGNTDKIIELFKAGRNATEISISTGDRIAFIKRVIYRLEHPTEFVIEPDIKRKRGRPKVIQSIQTIEPVKNEPVKVSKSQTPKKCQVCGVQFKAKGNLKYCVEHRFNREEWTKNYLKNYYLKHQGKERRLKRELEAQTAITT